MPDWIEIAGSGTGGGILGAIIAYFRVKVLKLEINTLKSGVDTLKVTVEKQGDKTVWRDTCIATHKAINGRLERIEDKVDKLLSRK